MIYRVINTQVTLCLGSPMVMPIRVVSNKLRHVSLHAFLTPWRLYTEKAKEKKLNFKLPSQQYTKYFSV